MPDGVMPSRGLLRGGEMPEDVLAEAGANRLEATNGGTRLGQTGPAEATA